MARLTVAGVAGEVEALTELVTSMAETQSQQSEVLAALLDRVTPGTKVEHQVQNRTEDGIKGEKQPIEHIREQSSPVFFDSSEANELAVYTKHRNEGHVLAYIPTDWITETQKGHKQVCSTPLGGFNPQQGKRSPWTDFAKYATKKAASKLRDCRISMAIMQFASRREFETETASRQQVDSSTYLSSLR